MVGVVEMILKVDIPPHTAAIGNWLTNFDRLEKLEILRRLMMVCDHLELCDDFRDSTRQRLRDASHELSFSLRDEQ